VEWLGEVPAHWEVKPFKRLASIRNGADFKHVADDNGNYPVYGSGGSFGKANAYLYDGESVLLGRKGTIDRPLYVNGPFWAVDTMFYTEISTAAVGRFVFYMATTIPFDLYSTNTALPSMTQEDLSSHIIASPDTQEQTAIAAFLDEKTAQIDQLIEKKTRFIELLKEKRAALITEAVTGRFDVRTGKPYAEYKDSGVAWLGEVPGHWSVTKIKYLTTTFEQGWSPQCENRRSDGNEYGVLKVGCVNGRNFNPMEHKALPKGIPPKQEYQIRKDDLLISRANTRELVGSAAVVDKDYPSLMLCDKLYRIRLRKRYSPQFLSQYLATHMARDQIEFGANGASASMQNIDQNVIRNFFLPLPQKEEIIGVVAYIKEKTTQIDQLIEKTQQSIDLLKEKRSALITAAVTGKIDVRNFNPKR
jgi:type I restriction enzyme S subunit